MTTPGVLRTLVMVGLQRSGNHGIQNWLGSCLPGFDILNDRPHDELPALLGRENTIVSFEDRDTPDEPRSLERVLATALAAQASDRGLVTLVVLRDPYNTLASRLQAHRTRGLTSNEDTPLFLELWKHLAGEVLRGRADGVLFDPWKQSRKYREFLCGRLGGDYSEATLNVLAKQGQGSSFDGLPSYTVREVLGKLPRLVAPGGARRVLSNMPTHLARTRRKPTASLKHEARYVGFVHDPEMRLALADPEIGRLCGGLFGFRLDVEGGWVPAGVGPLAVR